MPYTNEAPLHFEVLVNPHDLDGGAYVTTMYRRPGNIPYTPPSVGADGYGPGDDILSFIGDLATLLPAPVPLIVNALASKFYTTTQRPVWGAHGEIFSATDVRHGATSTEIGVALEDTADALEVILAAHRDAGPFAGFVALRFVRGTSATLGFTRFPMTCTIELPGILSAGSRSFFAAAFRGLESAGIPHTFHWGQEGNYSPEKVVAMYGRQRVDAWKSARSFLLDAPARSVFSNEFLATCGLS
jgi:hypothetical protein